MRTTVEDDRSVFRVQQRLQQDLEVAHRAKLVDEGSDAATEALQLHLHRRYLSTLKTISAFAEGEADAVEPLFTQFESILLKLEFGNRSGQNFGAFETVEAIVTILVVDDESLNIEVVKTCLKAAGYFILTAESYDEAVAGFDANIDEIGLLIADISLPGKTGIDLTVYCLSRNPNLKVLLMSGWIAAEFLENIGIPGGDPHFLPKPFRSSTLVNQVRRVLESTDQIRWLEQVTRMRIGGFYGSQ
jgi:CheY-like chemotaxis protein